jgi:AraC-like DNA-binding protein
MDRSSTDSSLADGAFIPDIHYLIFRKSTPAWHIKEHIVNNYNLTYLIKGKARYYINSVFYEVAAGDMIYTETGDASSAHTYTDALMECFSVNFSMKDRSGASLPFPPVSHIGLHRDIINLFHELIYVWSDRQNGYMIQARGLFFLILHRFLEFVVYKREPSTCDYRIKKILRYVAKYYAKKISMKKMALLVELNTVYLGALFKKETGGTLKQYVIKTRVRNAENLLRSGEYTVTEVAELCGYTDMFYFYKQFKSVLGIAPSRCIPKRGR